MKNKTVGRYEAEDLRKQVDKVLRGLGNPEPPLALDQVRTLQRLDRHYYSTQDDGVVREFVSKVIVAGKQILERPSRLWDVVRKAGLRALWVPEKRQILIDSELPAIKQRWAEAHEVGHSLAPWHGSYLYGDSREELKLSCHEKLESEANYTAGQLLFMADRFANEARQCAATIEVVKGLAKRYGNTVTSTLWRYVEENRTRVPMVGIISLTDTMARKEGEDSASVKYCVESPAFREQFGHVGEIELLDGIESYCSRARGGPMGEAEIVLSDVNGDAHVFRFESFNNRYNVLTIGVYIAPRPVLVQVIGTRV